MVLNERTKVQHSRSYGEFLAGKCSAAMASQGAAYFGPEALVFAYLHYPSVNFWNAPRLLLLLLPQFTSGVILCLVRLRCGIGYSIDFHAVHNTIIMVPTLLVLKA